MTGRGTKTYIIKAAAILLLAGISAMYFFGTERSSAWLPVEHASRGGFTVGSIAFSFYGEGGSDIPYTAHLTPTRYFTAGENRPAGDTARDALFNRAAAVNTVLVKNEGNIDITVSLSYEDEAAYAQGLYYVFVPIDEENPYYALFESGDYAGYLDGMLGEGTGASSSAARGAAIDELNRETAARINELFAQRVIAGETLQEWCYLIAWSEHDSADWREDMHFVAVSHTINLRARADQRVPPPR